ncbi:non-ribosomal peptide synthetase [Micromonospora craterilacus]|nr:non-ribosomal peptide synthetase [Micromonospora craterilacus]
MSVGASSTLAARDRNALGALLAELRQSAVEFRVTPDGLRCTAPPGVLGPDLLARIRDKRDELLHYLATAGIEATVALSAAQRGLWLHQRLAPRHSAYHIPLDVTLHGAARPLALRQALSNLVGRHEPLRTVYPAGQGRPAAHVLASRAVPLRLVDLTGLPADQRDRVAQALADAESRRAFDLATQPPMRAALLRTGPRQHRLLITRHHIASDGWSLRILAAEFAHTYRAAAAGVPPQLPALPWRYGDFARWQQRTSTAGNDPAVLRWRERLRGARTTVGIVDHRPSGGPPGASAARTLTRRVEPDLVSSIGRSARAADTTIFTLLAAALGLAVSSLTGGRDLVIGTPVSGRVRPETEPIIGTFATVLPLRLKLDPRHSLRTTLRHVHDAVAQALDDQQVPAETLAEALGRRRNGGYDLVFAFQNTPPARLDLADLQVSVNPSAPLAPKYPLAVTATPDAAGLTLLAEYDPDAVPHATVRQLLDRMITVLAGAADLDRAAPATADGPTGATLAGRFTAMVARSPDAVAVTDPDGHLSYQALAAWARRVAAALQAVDVGPDDRVAVLLPHGSPLVAALVGVVLAGAAYVPLDPDDPPARHESILDDAEVQAVLTGRAGRDELAWYPGPVLVLDDLPAAPPGAVPAPARHPDHLAYIVYTSGSTGTPKGVMISQRSLLALFDAAMPDFGFHHRDTWTMTHSAAFDFSAWELWGPLLHGARLVVVPREVARDPARLWQSIEREQVTVYNATPTALHALDAVPAAERAPATALRTVVLGGERCEPARLAPWITALHGAAPGLVNMYGITETTVHVTLRQLTRADAGASGSPIGRPLPGAEVHVLGPDGAPLPAGGDGELLVGGAGLARGYLNRPALTADRFRPHHAGPPDARLYRSGDHVARTDTGDLYFLGRLDRQVKIRGYRVEPDEVAAVLLTHPAVAAAAVVSEQADGRTVLVAYVVPAEAIAAPTPVELRRYLRARLPPYLVPARYLPVQRLPMTRNGKLDRAALHVAPPLGGDDEPSTDTERMVAALWSELLGVPRVGRHDDFFALGGDSLLVARLHARIPAVFGVEVSLRRVYEAFDVASLAELLDRLSTPLDLPDNGTV